MAKHIITSPTTNIAGRVAAFTPHAYQNTNKRIIAVATAMFSRTINKRNTLNLCFLGQYILRKFQIQTYNEAFVIVQSLIA